MFLQKTYFVLFAVSVACTNTTTVASSKAISSTLHKTTWSPPPGVDYVVPTHTYHAPSHVPFHPRDFDHRLADRSAPGFAASNNPGSHGVPPHQEYQPPASAPHSDAHETPAHPDWHHFAARANVPDTATHDYAEAIEYDTLAEADVDEDHLAVRDTEDAEDDDEDGEEDQLATRNTEEEEDDDDIEDQLVARQAPNAQTGTTIQVPNPSHPAPPHPNTVQQTQPANPIVHSGIGTTATGKPTGHHHHHHKSTTTIVPSSGAGTANKSLTTSVGVRSTVATPKAPYSVVNTPAAAKRDPVLVPMSTFTTTPLVSQRRAIFILASHIFQLPLWQLVVILASHMARFTLIPPAPQPSRLGMRQQGQEHVRPTPSEVAMMEIQELLRW